jgi:transposase-like protein
MIGFGPPSNRHARRQWWRRRIEQQAGSRLTVADFCQRHGINPAKFYWWRKRLLESADGSAGAEQRPGPLQPSQNATFVPVSIRGSSPVGQIEIEIGNACTVRLHGNIDPKLLRVAIRAAGQIGDRGDN